MGDEPVALKLLDTLVADSIDLGHLRATMAAQKTLAHDDIARILDVFIFQGRPVVVSQFAEGADLTSLLVHAGPLPPRVVLETNKSFQTFTQDLTAAIRKNKMGQVCWASAQAGAASIGVKIPGNQVFMIYRPDFAVRMLKASVEAGFEAPIRIYVVEQENGTAQVSYIKPSDVFAGYKNAELNAMARELDTIFAAILHDAM